MKQGTMKHTAIYRLLLLCLLVSESLSVGNNTSRCKKDVNTIFPSGIRSLLTLYHPCNLGVTGVCGQFADCYDCLEGSNDECGWCGGSGCGITHGGCYNKSARVHTHAMRHAGEMLCGSPEGDVWVASVQYCSYCSQFPDCNACLEAYHPHWQRKGAQCGWCKCCYNYLFVGIF
jgi:hypothetical protein